jgi:hypothetical protein
VSAPAELIPTTRRGWVGIAVVLGVLVVAFLLVTRFYNVEGGSRVSGGVGQTASPGLLVTIEPVSVDALRNTATVHLAFDTQGTDLIGSDARLTKNTRVAIGSRSGLEEVRFPAGTVLGQYETTIGIDGEQADYPFDAHAGYLTIVADTYEKAADGTVETTGVVPVGLQGTGGVNGWDTTMDLAGGMNDGAFAGLDFQRAFSTQVFAIMILAMASLLAGLAVVVGLLVHTRRRTIEVTLLSWTAALLFALPLLRNYMPNSPPIGASIDVYVYLWVMVAAVAAAVLVILAWARKPMPPHGPVAPAGENAPHAT